MDATEAGRVDSKVGNELANKIARLVEERGWNQEDFARISKLNRHTVRQILHGGPKRQLRNATVSQCAKALGLTVSELRNLPLERLLPRMLGKPRRTRRHSNCSSSGECSPTSSLGWSGTASGRPV